MRKYESYKESGIAWIGEIPAHWNKKRLFAAAKVHFIPNRTVHHQNLLSLSYGKIIRKSINETKGLLPASFDGYQIVESGNIVLRLTDLQNDHRSLRVGLVKEEGIVTSAYLALEVRNGIEPEYLYLLLHTNDIHKVFYGMGGGLRQSLDFPELRKLPIIIPPIPEQRAIVAFLDNATEKIDKYTALKEQEIEKLSLLKQSIITDAAIRGLNPNATMKDSGIPWIGQVPEHWEIVKIRERFTERKTKVSDKDYQPLSVAKIGVVPQLEDACKTDNGDNRKLVKAGDFVVNSRSDRKGSCGISPLDGSVSLINIVLTPHDMDSQYVHHLLRSNDYIEEFYRNGRGIVADLWTTRYSEMKNICIPCPPLEEQHAIVAYMEEKTRKIGDLITNIQSELDKLKFYKQRLIADAVTGKFKVEA